ncbi:HalOD1 output domain-containing protein [Halalkaliarchaeum sp. AArc-GB]|uniref:HalOD1 output domain-containing protein n=1 Tax=Halalkaliarchaeum sp. AArc-GB TaxID=3074078 RepID=UPI00285F6A5A|nr:HalOD1 output domain-containing protein [Halalkaliarchaeum sp. AArc-GB]MDR5674359.1 HalOD1 output domain-containing protein [Halalkaliarchaeum sp. AArc-GB]
MDTKVAGVGVETVEYFQESGTVRTQFDHEKTPASMAVIATLADVMGTDPVELDPLHSTVDPDALDAFVRVRYGTNGDSHVTFTHEGHAITVHSYGVITITSEHEPTAEKYEKGAGI